MASVSAKSAPRNYGLIAFAKLLKRDISVTIFVCQSHKDLREHLNIRNVELFGEELGHIGSWYHVSVLRIDLPPVSTSLLIGELF